MKTVEHYESVIRHCRKMLKGIPAAGLSPDVAFMRSTLMKEMIIRANASIALLKEKA
jgi:hypothetical protein